MRRLVSILALLTVAGCGGGGDAGKPSSRADESRPGAEAVRQTVEAYFGALSARRVKHACRLLTAEARDRLAADDLAGRKRCVRRLRESLEALPRYMRLKLRRARFERVVIDGAKATVSMRGGVVATHAERLSLEASGDRWRLTALPGAYSKDDRLVDCVVGNFSAWVDGSIEPYWRREGQRDFEEYLRRICGRIARVPVGSTSRPGRLFARIARRTLQGMVREGRIAPVA